MQHVNPADAWESLFRAQVSIMRDLRADFTGQGMTMNEYDVLFNVAREPKGRILLRQLNRNVLITQSSVSRLVDRLIDRGYLGKCGDPEDARGAIVYLTDEGEAAFRAAGKVHESNIVHRLGVLSADEIDQLHAICAKLLPSESLQCPDAGLDNLGCEDAPAA